VIDFKYRPDVDGLRAVAVLLVLLFHARFGFTGGYVGVDVFFVISGFLITGLIVRKQEEGTFSLAGFWVRRIRRIIPAATFLTAVTLIAGVVLLLPEDLEELAQSTVAQQLMAANFFFWLNTDYFAGPAEMKPLLHMWSLAVEEQFYLGYPFLLILGRRVSRKTLLWTLATLSVATLALSELQTHTRPLATFFLLPTRAWELLLGALLVWCPQPTRLRRSHIDILSALGLAAILGSGWFFHPATRFPGVSALVPCAGTALVVYANSSRLGFVGRALATPPMVAIGLMSYSLYLWHWPILTYLRYWLGSDLSVPIRVAALGLSLGLAYLSWNFVETPFRRGKRDKKFKQVVTAAVVSAGCLAAISLWIGVKEGLPSRWPDRVLRLTDDNSVPQHYATTSEPAEAGDLPMLGSPAEEKQTVLLWGDSHALALAELCDRLAVEYGIRLAIAARPAMAPLLETWRPGLRDEMVGWNRAVLQYVENHGIQNVILVARWAVNIEGRPDGKTDSLIVDEPAVQLTRETARAALGRGLERTVAALEAAGATVWIVKQVPLQKSDPMKALVLASLLGRAQPSGITKTVHEQRQANVSEVIDVLQLRDSRRLDPADWCFDDLGASHIGRGGRSLYADPDHLSPYGAQTLLHPMLEPVFREIAERQRLSAPLPR